MFTGIVQAKGQIDEIQTLDRAIRFMIRAPNLSNRLPVGESVCVQGVCLTLVTQSGEHLSFDVVEETLQRSSLGQLTAGAYVNLEPPLALNSLLGGHLVQGHVDATARVQLVETRGLETWMTIAPPASLLRYVVEKGSIAVDGVSLTVAAVDNQTFSIAIIPHTAQMTTLGESQPGSLVNLEVDVIAKYLEKLAAPYTAGSY